MFSRVFSDGLSCKNLFYQFCKFAKTGFHVGAEMNAQRSSIAFRQNVEVASGLRGFDDSESVLLFRDRQVLRVFASDLEEDAAVRAAFVGLSSGVQEAGAEAETGRDALTVADGCPQFL
jgi:hypothetical protein